MNPILFPTEESKKNWIDIGSDHYIHYVTYKDDPKAGLNVMHLRLHPDGTGEMCKCMGFIAFEGHDWASAYEHKMDTWQVLSADPLTCSPSLLCRTCGDHGFIREGKWVVA